MIKTLKRYYNLLDKHKGSLLIAMFLCVANAFFEIMPVKFIGTITDAIKSNVLTYNYLIKYIIILVSILFFSYVSGIYYNYVIFRNYYFVDQSLRVEILRKTIRQSPGFFTKFSASNILTRATSDTDAVGELASYGLLTAFEGFIMPLVYFFIIGNINIWLLFIAIIALPVMVIFIIKISKYHDKAYKESMESQDSMNENALESLTFMKVIKAFGLKKIKLNEFLEKVDMNHKKELKLNNLQNLYMPVVTGVMSFFSILSIMVGALLIGQGKITLGDLVTHSLLLAYLSWPAFAVSDLILLSKSGSISLSRIDEILDYKNKENLTNKAYVNEIKSINLTNFSFKYPNSDSYILKNINLSIKEGQKIGIVGKTGSGKSTLIKQIVREYREFSGRMTINGLDIKNINLDSYLKHVGYVPQEHFLFSKTIKDNILFYREGDYKRAIEMAQLKKDLSSLPNDLESLCGEMGITLSGGQKQRVSLARGLLSQPQLLILDDVLSAVDSYTEGQIISSLKSNFSFATIIISSHKLSVVEDADEIIVLDQGEIIERGNFKNLISQGGWFSEQYKLQEVSHE